MHLKFTYIFEKFVVVQEIMISFGELLLLDVAIMLGFLSFLCYSCVKIDTSLVGRVTIRDREWYKKVFLSLRKISFS